MYMFLVTLLGTFQSVSIVVDAAALHGRGVTLYCALHLHAPALPTTTITTIQ